MKNSSSEPHTLSAVLRRDRKRRRRQYQIEGPPLILLVRSRTHQQQQLLLPPPTPMYRRDRELLLSQALLHRAPVTIVVGLHQDDTFKRAYSRLRQLYPAATCVGPGVCDP